MLYKPTSPPMGWNSFDCYGWSVDEDEFRENVDFMAENLLKFGYEYCVVDFCWFRPGKGKISPPNQVWTGNVPDVSLVLDPYGRPMPAPDKFPSCRGGFKALADHVHKKGLKFGLHFMSGIPRQAVVNRLPVFGSSLTAADIASDNGCDWLNLNLAIDYSVPGAEKYVRSVVRLIDEWDVDFIKLDDALRPIRKEEIAVWAEALGSLPRKVVLSLSPGEPPITEAEFLREYSAMWRVMDDLWDRKEDLKKITRAAARWHSALSEGAYPDLDMLPVGRLLYSDDPAGRGTRLTKRAEKYMFTLWCFARSPLILGGRLNTLSPYELGLVTDGELLKISQNSENTRMYQINDNIYVWASETQDTEYYALFNSDTRFIRKASAESLSNIAGCDIAAYMLRHSQKAMYLRPLESRVLRKPK